MKNLIIPFLLLFLGFSVNAQDSTASEKAPIIIGLTQAPPFVMKQDGRFSGLSIESWRLVNRKLDYEYEFREFEDLEALLSAVEKGDVDLSINPITVTDQRMSRMDFSQPYFISYTGIARKSGSTFWRYLSNIFSWNFFSAILVLVSVIFIFGFLVWLFERKKNKEEFGSGLKGVLQGFWWSAVTMTTVGYGDKSPRTFGGRFIGFIWMFMAIIMISTLTAGIASSLTVHNIQEDISSVQDLDRFEVYTVKSSSAQELLEQYGINTSKISNADEGIEAIIEGDNNLLVYDKPILGHRIEEKGLEDELVVLEVNLKKDYYSYSFPKDSDLLKKIDPILVGTLKSMEWSSLISEYK
ncbi:MAG: transporter substrate-binding domain-containing protein [Christiangramia sp.]|nr:transporter substrate-binding domain-containing protein [Christiangramia sp.]